MNLREIQKAVHGLAREKGFYDFPLSGTPEAAEIEAVQRDIAKVTIMHGDFSDETEFLRGGSRIDMPALPDDAPAPMLRALTSIALMHTELPSVRKRS